MLRSFISIFFLLLSLTASAYDCSTYTFSVQVSGESSSVGGCLIFSSDAATWNSYGASIGSLGGTVSSHSSTLSSYGSTLTSYGSTINSHTTTINSQGATITAQAAQIAALQAAVTALQEGGTGPELPMIFDITEQQGVDIALAILALWAVAWIFRTIISVVKQDEKE